MNVIAPINKKMYDRLQTGKQHYTLMVDSTNECQMACGYCYFGEKQEKLMDVSVLTKSVEKFINAIGVDNIGNLNVNYMGGEPLLAFSRIKDMSNVLDSLQTKYGISISWSLTSNLVGLTQDIADFMIEKKAMIHCSIDGPPEIHNRNRPIRKDLRDTVSYDMVEQAKLALQVYPRDHARATIRPSDADKLDEIAQYIFSLGFKSAALFPAVGPAGNKWNPDRVAEWKASMVRLIDGLQKGENITTIIGKKSFSEKYSYCGAGSGLWAVDLHGDIHPCHHFTNDTEDANGVGKVLFEQDSMQVLDDMLSFSIPTEKDDGCSGCPANNHCAGNCWAESITSRGSYTKPDYNICALKIATLEAMRETKYISDTKEQFTCQCSAFCMNCEICQGCEGCEGCTHGCESGQGDCGSGEYVCGSYG